jgi:hypothetical protein
MRDLISFNRGPNTANKTKENYLTLLSYIERCSLSTTTRPRSIVLQIPLPVYEYDLYGLP